MINDNDINIIKPKKQRYKKNQLLHSKELFNKALDNLTNINLVSVENRIEKETSKIDLSLLLTANDKDFAPLMTQYCNKTGTELNKLDIDNLKLLIAVHGKSEALELLRLDACGQYSPLWLHSEPKTLNKLMYFDPQGFFVYAASHIFHADIVKKAGVSKVPPHSQAGKESTEDKNLQDFMNNFPSQDKPEDLINREILEDVNIRYFNLQDKIIANRNLNLYCNEINITETNELLRRFLGLANPEKVASFINFSFEFLYQITETEESLKQFNNELKNAIKSLFTQYFKKIKRKKSEGFAIRLQGAKNNRLHSGTIAEVKSKFGGFTNFHKQPKIRNQNNKESILYDLKGFWDNDTENNDLLKDFAGRGKSINFDANSEGLDCNTGEPLNIHKVKSGTKIKLNINIKKD